jgi:hypothetical protein
MDGKALVLLSMMLALLVACTSRREGAAPVEAGAAAGPYGGPTVADSLYFTLERTPCLGPCPAYRIHLYRSGYATYEGISHVERMGMHATRIGTDTLRALLDEFERSGFFGLRPTYDGPITDVPSTIMRMVFVGKDHTVHARVKVPQVFTDLAAFAEELLLPNAWKPLPMQE